MNEATLFERVAIIGFGLMGSSMARAIRKYRAASQVIACDAGAGARATAA